MIFSYAAISTQSGVCEVSIALQTSALLTEPSAETPSTVKAKLICTEPTPLAAETPVTERVEFATIVAEPTPLAAETPVTLCVTGTCAETVPIALAAETPVTLILIGRTTVAEPTALAAETPVTSTGIGLSHAPEFQVLLFQPVIKAIMQS
jgi:hypothetical protein